MSHKHKDEIIKWANAPEGTNVWYKCGKHWTIIKQPSWQKEFPYIVDNEYAELRKALFDGRKLELNDGLKNFPSWNNAFPEKTNLETYPANSYRIKPEIIVKWQWTYLEPDTERYWITNLYYETKEQAIEAMQLNKYKTSLRKLEESRKEFKL